MIVELCFVEVFAKPLSHLGDACRATDDKHNIDFIFIELGIFKYFIERLLESIQKTLSQLFEFFARNYDVKL